MLFVLWFEWKPENKAKLLAHWREFKYPKDIVPLCPASKIELRRFCTNEPRNSGPCIFYCFPCIPSKAKEA
jgi:hypothetical protein